MGRRSVRRLRRRYRAQNWLIVHVGIPTAPGGPHLTPVGFGLLAPSGVWAAAVSLPGP